MKKERKVIETNGFSDEITLRNPRIDKTISELRAFAILMKDKQGQVIYTFDTQEKADEFYKELKKNLNHK